MESWQEFIPLSSKSYSRYGRIVLTIIFLLAAIFIAVGYDLDEKANFRCNPNKTVAADLIANNYVLAKCYMQYEKEHHPTVPVGRFVIINFGLMLLISIAYVGIVNAKVEKFDTVKAQNNSEIGQEFWEQERYQEERIFIFPSYILHLFIGRVFPLILFIILIQSANFPVQFNCSYPIETTMRSNATNHNQPSNHTTEVPKVKITTLFTVECVNPLGDKFKTLATSVLWADCFIGIVAILEIMYLLHRIKKDFDFACDLEFCSMYILEKRNLTIRQILKRFRKRIREDERFQKVQLRFNEQRKALGDFQFRFLVHNELDREILRRHEMYNVHLKQDLVSIKSRLVYIFLLNNVQIVIGNAEVEIFQLAGKILCVGRAGIGKSTVTKAILNRWANYKFLEDKVIILLRFRNFRRNKTTNFKKMLRLGEGTPTGSNFEELYKFILANPKKITLIFDGLDDLKVDIERCLQELDEDTTNDYEEPLSMFTIYIKLLKDKLLPGATILTTSRISYENEKIWEHFQIQFQTRLELLGFSKREIIGNVKEFCKADTKASDWIWRTIKNNPEFLSLCYVPETCDLVCSTLKECFDSAVTERDLAKFLPKTMTEMYHRAVRVILWKKLKYTNMYGSRGYLTSGLPNSLDEFMKTLTKLAKCKMDTTEVSFQLEAGYRSQTIINCGLLVPQPEEYYSFLHLTVQEFLAAWYIVDEINDTCDATDFLSSLSNYLDKPAWHLVFQFAVGLLGEKVKKRRDMPKDMISRSLMQCIRPLTSSTADKAARKTALFVVKCLHEMQDPDIMQLCASEVNGGGNNECNFSGLSIEIIDSKALFQLLVYVGNLIKLNLTNSKFSDVSYMGLVKLLNENVNLTVLNLSRCSIGDKGVQIICDNLNSRNRKLADFILEVNQITAEGVKSLCDAIMDGKLNLTYLNLRSNAITVHGAETLSRTLIHDNCNITRLNLSGNSIGNDGVVFLCLALQHKNCELDYLCLNRNNITKDGVTILCEVLKEDACRLTKLDLQFNNLTAFDIEPLCDALMSGNCPLTKLDLTANELADTGAQYLSAALTGTNGSRLKHLYLGHNKMKDCGVQFICEALKNENCKLTHLHLPCNEIGDDGVVYLCDALKNSNCEIVNLELTGNNMTNEDITRLRNSTNLNPNRRRIFSICH